MVHGTRHHFSGTLLSDGDGSRLRLADGREWRLSVPPGSERFVGELVSVSGVRGENGLLYVEELSRA